MTGKEALEYLHRHYVAWLLQGQWQPELSLPDGMYPTDGEWMLLAWRLPEPLAQAAWQDAEATVCRSFAGVCELWPLCRGEQVYALTMAKTLSTPAMQAALWVAATGAAEALHRTGGAAAPCLLSDVCHSYAQLPAAPMAELNAWWTVRSMLSLQERREHRKRMQNYLKKGQYGHISGYAARCLRRDARGEAVYWHWLPMAMESLWLQQRPSMSMLTKHLNWTALMQEGAEALVVWLRRTCEALKTAATPDDPIRRVTESIRMDCSLPYSQTNLADGLGLTPAYFSRLFEKRTGTRFTAYLTDARIARAQQLLRGSATLGEVAAASGFQRKSYFCEVFRKHTGMTALQYRAMHTEKGEGL